jgi:hypothetical protein
MGNSLRLNLLLTSVSKMKLGQRREILAMDIEIVERNTDILIFE